MTKKWWQDAVIYQVYPRSFQDSNEDGIGDLKGIIQRLDYLEKLGITGLWISPVYASPNDDNGYDISDYQEIQPEYGTMEDMDELLDEAKKRNIKVIMDLVVNHTSDEHRWFTEAKKSKENRYRDYYIWRDKPNELTSDFGGSAWEYDEVTQQYYLHIHSKKQPDLNWENPKLRQEIWQMMTFWLDKGVGGFRMDVIDLIGKEPENLITKNGPMLHPYLREMNEQSFGQYDVVTVGETWGATPEIAKEYSHPARQELSMVFQFEHINLDKIQGQRKWDLKTLNPAELHQVFSKWQVELGNEGWNSLFWNNHDLPRIVSRWGDDGEYRVESAKMLAIYLHGMKGTPYIYQGEEIGMTNYPITEISEVDDIESRRMYEERLHQGYAKESLIKSINAKGRDNARHPMQWGNELHGGFTKGTPWLPVHKNSHTINVENALADSNSIFYTYQKLIALRKENSILVEGDYQQIETGNPVVLAYLRTEQSTKWLTIVNFSKESQYFQLNQKYAVQEIVISNYEPERTYLFSGKLEPFEAVTVVV
ncbi:glycoside hydrolase family 13 protein [Carnobacterium divergens]|uniref:glycoside hydrolase family 13 protein n=1 Tax=Carnobacterium divergens TaxID=2748 RepID=UPI0007F430B4|nr:alpha-glucosidase [Carnobacterium divergens]SBO18523.1 Glucan 1,6-alpha-glucosidase [Carnobacterium divergens]